MANRIYLPINISNHERLGFDKYNSIEMEHHNYQSLPTRNFLSNRNRNLAYSNFLRERRELNEFLSGCLLSEVGF